MAATTANMKESSTKKDTSFLTTTTSLPPHKAEDAKRHRFEPWVGKIPWRRRWQSTLVFLPEKSHEQRILVDYSPWSQKSRTGLSTHTHTHTSFPLQIPISWKSINNNLLFQECYVNIIIQYVTFYDWLFKNSA